MESCRSASNRILTDIFLTLASSEILLEQLRVDLCIISDFTIHAAFYKLDIQGSGYVTAFEVFRFIRNFTQDVSEEDCRRVVDYFDTDGNGALCL